MSTVYEASGGDSMLCAKVNGGAPASPTTMYVVSGKYVCLVLRYLLWEAHGPLRPGGPMDSIRRRWSLHFVGNFGWILRDYSLNSDCSHVS